jgi:hypothetical protein
LLSIHVNDSASDRFVGSEVVVHRAYTVIFPVTVAEAVNSEPPPLVAVYHPPKAYPLRAGSEGILEAPTEPPLDTPRVWVMGVPPSALKVTVYWLTVHRAYTVISAVTVVE